MGKGMAGNDFPRGDWVLEEMLKVAMEDEKSDREKYRRLAKMADREKDARKLYGIADDEANHLKALQFLYGTLFGRRPPRVEIQPVKISNFTETIRKSIVSEYEGTAFYREILNRLCCEEFKSIIRRIMADEQRHAQILESILEK